MPSRSVVASFAVAMLGASALTTAPVAAAATATYDQPDRILIETRYGPRHAGSGVTVPDSGRASAYPWSVTVQETAAKVTGVSVVLYGVTHPNPDDLDLMLVGPTGTSVVLLSDAGGSNALSGAQFYIADTGVSAPDTGAISAFTQYKPTNHDGGDADTPAPAPSATATAMSAFNGTNPTGTWSLYVYDDNGSASGSLSDWRLEVQTDLPVPSTAAPFPSTVSVANAPSVVTDVDVALDGLTHGVLDTLDLLLVGPGGQKAMLMSDAGGTSPSGDAANVDVTFDDEAASTVPNAWVNLATGSYRPVNYDDGGTDTFPGVDTTGAANALSVFDGTDPNGQWKLYVVEDSVGAGGEIAGGWSLNITTADPTPAPPPDTTPPTGWVTVGAGALWTRTPAVSLALSASDAVGVTSMRFSNDGTTWSAFSPYATSAPWTLTSGPGSKTVYAQFADAAGNISTAVSDTISYDAVSPKVGLTRPIAGADGVRVGKTIKVFFSEKVARATLTKANVKLMRKGSTRAVRATLRYDEIRRKLVIDPKRALRPDTTYKVLIRVGVKDLAGNNFDQKRRTGMQPKRFRFTTR